ncbi:GNAT family N-acetyltransferase [Kribbella sp. CA-293567]|uniref:GNAT family N-acetyltransferase n=1 Tax=Kribbella sp. CA-293567 TaxID=3002436 RepID=UPI0022DE01AC|nr:GNAT family N-acetyltransferase [Kribbella sp. CA-293567]WBQ04043.1 GNAT family N-acetyltransferase [Kribbella sp. CA-293567]
MTDFDVRPAESGDYEELGAVFAGAMMFEPSADELGRSQFEPERALAVTDGEQIVGTTRALTRDLSVPGAVVPAAHVTGVGVRATHRRRGIMAQLISRQLRDVPEAIAVLWASESGIYGRFGYGAAAFGTSYEIDLHRVGPPSGRTAPGEVSVLPADDAAKELAPLLRTLQERRPGISGRSELGWQQRLVDKPEERGGKTARQVLVHRDETGTIDGYALWRGKLNWGPTGPANEVYLEELVTVRPTAYKALWQHLLTLDLAGTLHFGFAAVDEPLQQLVTTPTALNRRVSESLWVRVTDVARALGQRRYAVAVDLVLEVADELIPANAGRYRLTADGASVRCERTDDAADLSLSVTELGATYLGGRRLAEFAATGRVTEHTPGALDLATAAFGWPVAPVSVEIF